MRRRSEDAFARATPKRVTIEEAYAYRQGAQGPLRDGQLHPETPPHGHLQIEVPFDGYKYVHAETVADGNRHRLNGPPADRLTIGHLLLRHADRTDLAESIRLKRYGGHEACFVTPLRLPADLPNEVAAMTHHDHGATAEASYEPVEPAVFPLRVELDANDVLSAPDTLSTAERTHFNAILRLHLKVHLHVPARGAARAQGESASTPCRATTRLRIAWPTATSPKKIHPPAPYPPASAKRSGRGAFPAIEDLRYNPSSRNIEWTSTDRLSVRREGDEPVIKKTVHYVVDVRQPGELAAMEQLHGSVEVDVSNCVLSGLTPALLDARGNPADIDTERTTHLSCSFTFSLDDVFNERDLEPYYKLHFDDVIPDDNRIRDLKHVLKEQGFEEQSSKAVRKKWTITGWEDYDIKNLYQFDRRVGPDTMTLLILVVGRIHRTELKTEMEGETYRSERESGEMEIHLFGKLPRNDQSLIREMNRVHEVLHNISSYVRSRR